MTVTKNQLILPVDPDQTIAAKFAEHGWTCFQDMIDAGYPYAIQPTKRFATWEYTINYEAVIETARINLAFLREDIVGHVPITPRISYSLDGVTWTDGADGASQLYAINFQYVKILLTIGSPPMGSPIGILAAITFDVTEAGTSDKDFCVISDIRVKLDVKKKHDEGFATISTAASGVVVNFSQPFADITSISVAAAGDGTRDLKAIYDFVDVPNPTHMTIYLLEGVTKVTGNVSWQVTGI